MSTFKILYIFCPFFTPQLFEIFVQFETVNFVWLFGSPWNTSSSSQKSKAPSTPHILRIYVPMALPLSMTSFLMAFVLKRDFRFAERVLWLPFMVFETHKWMSGILYVCVWVSFCNILNTIYLKFAQHSDGSVIFFRVARGVCVMCVRHTLKMYQPNEAEMCTTYRLKCKKNFAFLYMSHWHILIHFQKMQIITVFSPLESNAHVKGWSFYMSQKWQHNR